jgi:hypothetical protein
MATQRGPGSEGRVEREGSSVSESAGDEFEATCVCGAGKAFTEGGCTEEVVLCANVWYAWADERLEGSSDPQSAGFA